MTAEILIIDDNADIRNILNDVIIDAGYKTRVAANYSQALTEIDKKLPDENYNYFGALCYQTAVLPAKW